MLNSTVTRTRAVARPWRERQLPRAPVLGSAKINKYLTKKQKTKLNSQMKILLLLSIFV